MSVEEDTELRDLVAQTLEVNGVLNKIRAELRANVFLALEEHDALTKKSIANKKLQSFLSTKEGHQAFSIVREFLQFFNLDFTLAVLDPESNYAGKASSRANLINEINLNSVDGKIPVLSEVLKRRPDSRSASPTSSRSGSSKIPQRIQEGKHTKTEKNKNSEVPTYNETRTLITADDDEDEDELLRELGVSPISKTSNGNKKKPSWLSSDPLNKPPDKVKKVDDTDVKSPPSLGSLKNIPPLPGVKGKNTIDNSPPIESTSPEWDDIMKIDKKITALGFEVPKDDSYKEKLSSKESDYNYEDDFNASNSQKSDGLSITEEIEDDISIGSFAGSKGEELITTDQTVSQISGTGFDYGEDAEI